MKKLSRLFLLTLLILALPLQGLAAASMMYCGTQQHQPVSTVQQQHSHSDCHTATLDNSSQKLKKDKCSSCAACCVGAALVSVYTDTPLSGPSSEKIDLAFSSHVVHVSDGLERPPRA